MPTKKEVKRRLRKIYNGEWSIHTKNKFMGDQIKLNGSYIATISLANSSMQMIIARAFLGMSWMSNKPIKVICQLKKK